MVTFGVLGPLTAGSARLGGPKQRAVLARLLVARRRVVPVRTLVDDLWEDPPDGAVGTVQTFVGALRKALEPDRPPRTPSTLLVTEGAGYALLASDVDAWRFEEVLGGDLSVLDGALALWRGPAYAEFADFHWARAEIDRLEELRLVAVERRAAAALALGRSAEVVADLRAHLAGHPWREKAWSLLALALYREGRQGDALGAVREARQALVENLGVDPGEELRSLESDILAQSPRLLPSSEPSLVGRAAELALLDTAVPAAGLGLALVTGEAGVGKTALATAFTELLAGRGWRTVWARCQEDAPVAWPWQQVVEALGEELVAAERFQLRLSIVSTVESAAPVLVVLDDLHQADEETLAVLAAFTGRVLSGRVLIVATSRSAVPSEALARAEPVRVQLGGLDEEAVAALVGPRDARAIHHRTGGNPFYVKELRRLVASGGDLGSVPAGVRDVLRHRLAGLPPEARTVLHQASVLGRDVEVDLLDALAGHDVLDALDLAIEAGFVVEVAPGRARFTHQLVRDTLYEDVSLTRRARWHAVVAEAMPPGDVQLLAHHHALAGTRSPEAVSALAEAAAGNRSPREAVRLWRAALAAAGSERLDLLTGLVRALAVSGDLEGAREHRSAALRLAEGPDEVAEVIGSFDVPGIWTTNDDPAHSAELVAAAERVLPAFPGPTATRARLLATIAMEDRGTGTRLGEAREAEATAHALGDPELLAFALNARFMHTFHRTGLAPDRAAIGRELLEVASGRLVTHEVLGHLVLVQACSALADFAAADEHAAAADELAQRHDLPLVGLFTDWYAALKLAAAGRKAEADSAYRAAAGRVRGTGIWGMERGLLPLALLSLHGPSTVDLADDWGPHLDWVRPLALPHDEALKAARALPDGPADLLTEVRACLLAMAATRLRDDELAERAHALLLPAKDEFVAGTGLFTFGPVADYLRG
ncbi:BTAD domain-containing putative transcriptional regulator [Lentzea flaviverrucosa]|uniref:DNA-binding transcriptional activator of the SARP family n=1 Tax=Lentzea flaviverrucosa TaxID=200379 RepID=A0A1H9CZM5_9PSEU|nr:BTAD domain-containing putative transcriptional regulator [Lentzea flaviverrucosa]RDI24698.1 DNA-binding SARP family transcriptional activator [Lentzea flaviverrucosa]SEQ06644.1 DNA-binding transcriptional activator of the SARP family [Lentzea flaviverrucosa]